MDCAGTYMPFLMALVADSALNYSHRLKAIRAGKAIPLRI